MRRIFVSFSFALVFSIASIGSVSAGVIRNHEVDTDWSYFELRDSYPGGAQALPYGNGDAAAVLVHARGMSAVNGAVATLEARGYVRRSDIDVAGTQLGFSFACIAFEKPGSPVADRQPLLVVATQAVEISGVGYRPATEIYAGLFADSAGKVRVTSTPADSAVAFVGELLGPPDALTTAVNACFGVPVGVDVTDENLEFRYSAYEHAQGTWQYHNTTSPEMQGLMSQAYQTVAWNVAGGLAGGATGFMAGPTTGIATMLLGGYTSGLVAWKTFWIGRDSTHVRR